MHRRIAPWVVALLCGTAVVAVPSSPARACIHAAQAADTPVTQKGQRILVVHDGKVQTTVLRVDYEVGAALSDLAMVLPVPSVPTRYETGDPKLFDALETWAPLERPQPALRSASAGAKSAAVADPPAIELLEPVKTGPYAIQPIKARGAAGAKALGTWLSDNGYTPIPDEALGYYIDNEWAFLAVKTSAGDAKLDKSGALPPLSFSFPSAQIVVPLKLEAQGVFPVRVYTVSTRVLGDADFSGALAKGFEVASAPGHKYLAGGGAGVRTLATPVGAFGRSTAPAELGAVFKSAGLTAPELHLRVMFAENFGEGAADPAKWADELAVPTLASALAGGEAKDEREPERANAKPVPKSAPPKSAPPNSEPTNSEPTKACAVGRPRDVPPAVWLLALVACRRRRR